MITHGKTILVSSHKILDILIYMKKTLILDKGRELYYGSLDELFKKLGIIRFYIKLEEDINRVDVSTADVIDTSGKWVTLETDDIVNSLMELSKGDYKISSILIEEPSLDELIIKLYQRGDID